MSGKSDLRTINDPAASTSRRADAYAVLFALVFPTLLTWVYFVLLAGQEAGTQAAYGLGKCIQFAFPLFWFLAAQRRRLRWKPPGTPGLAESVAFGVFVFAAMLLMYHAWLKPEGYLDAAVKKIGQKVADFGADTPTKYFVLAAFYSLVHSFLEEYYWRWFVFGQLRRLVPLWAAVLVSSAGFMAHHVVVLGTYFGWFSVATVFFSLAVAAGGAVWAWIYHRSDSLYGPWLSHVFVDAGIFVIGYHLVGSTFGA